MTSLHLTLVLIVFLTIFSGATVILAWSLLGRLGGGRKPRTQARIKTIVGELAQPRRHQGTAH